MARVRLPGRPSDRHAVKVRLRRAGLHTVCEEARCPNISECFGARTATFLILGDACTRSCRFCGIARNASPSAPDPDEPRRLAETVRELELAHAVITSVTRDDLSDGGAGHFVACVERVRELCPSTTVELLVPDFRGRAESASAVLDARPEVFNHNVETVPRLYPLVRPEADLDRSLELLKRAAGRDQGLVKSGLMVGLGETDDEVWQVLERLAAAGCRVVTIGQYLRPARWNLSVERQVTREQYSEYRRAGQRLGIRVLAGPLVRSSWHAHEILQSAEAG